MGTEDPKTRKVELSYPRNEGNDEALEVELMDVRAADSLRIEYDFERDGWSIQQASRFSWESNDEFEEIGEDWKEVAFVQAWQRKSCANVMVEPGQCGPQCPECSDE